MGYDFRANNKELDDFHFSIWAWPRCLDIFGYLFPHKMEGPKWVCNFDLDKRMGSVGHQPLITTNDGFKVTSLESRVMARMIKNYIGLEKRYLADKKYWEEELESFSKWLKESKGFRIF